MAPSSPATLTPDQTDLIYTRKQIEAALDEQALRLTEILADRQPLVITVLNGGLIYAGNLLPRLEFALEMDYCHATRYRGNTVGAELHWQATPHRDLDDRHVLLLDDIFDEGHTLEAIAHFCHQQGARSLHTAVLINKCHKRKPVSGFQPDFMALEVPDRYVFGFGMDYQGLWRNAPGIYALP